MCINYILKHNKKLNGSLFDNCYRFSEIINEVGLKLELLVCRNNNDDVLILPWCLFTMGLYTGLKKSLEPNFLILHISKQTLKDNIGC